VLYTKSVLVSAVDVWPAGARSYRSLAQAACGKRIALLTQAAVIAFCFGFLVVDLVVVADLLVGSPSAECSGLICLLTGVTSGPLADRSVALAAVSLGVAAPLLLLRWVGGRGVCGCGCGGGISSRL